LVQKGTHTVWFPRLIAISVSGELVWLIHFEGE